jgi:hypothetical protein
LPLVTKRRSGTRRKKLWEIICGATVAVKNKNAENLRKNDYKIY